MNDFIDIWTIPEDDSAGKVRDILSRYANIPSRELEFVQGNCGKPALASRCGGDSVHYNLSHSAGISILAVSDDPVGIDIEKKRSLASFEDTLDFAFCEEERRIIEGLTGEEHQELFFKVWVRKEACVKALGLDALAAAPFFQVIAESSAAEKGWEFLHYFLEDGRAWYLYELRPTEGYETALFSPKPECDFRHYTEGSIR